MGSSPSVAAVVDLHLLPVEGGRLAGFVDAYEREGRVLLRPNWQFPRNLWGDLYAAPVITFFTKPGSLGAPARAALQPIYAETIPAFSRLAEGDVLLMIEGRVSGVATVVAIEEFANTAGALAELQRVHGE